MRDTFDHLNRTVCVEVLVSGSAAASAFDPAAGTTSRSNDTSSLKRRYISTDIQGDAYQQRQHDPLNQIPELSHIFDGIHNSMCRVMSISRDVGSSTPPNEPNRSYFGSTRLRLCTPQ